MAGKNYTHNFDMADSILKYDPGRSTLLCIDKSAKAKKIWIKKILDITDITNVFEDGKRYFIACESGEINGQFLALFRSSGSTAWFIPGKSFLQVLFEGFLYLIFIDENGHYYLLKVNCNNGKALWHHRLDPDLFEYAFTKKEVRLSYTSGKKEILSLRTGKRI
ncbi:MAG: hypothetical protein MUC95_03015 [Spirochaetes bacterium]|nr:hypothetical protein [Spirochaetota bacterium]